MNRSARTLVVALLVAAGLWLPSPVLAQWRITNNLDERFTVTVWPESNDRQMTRVVLPRGQTREVRLGQDRHLIQLVSGGGNIYILEPATLRDEVRPTLLKDILTPAGRSNGRIKYNYMNQRGFNESEDSADLQNLSRSSWDSEYQAPSGTDRIKARIDFGGDGATYRTAEFSGQLSQVRFRRAGNLFVVDGQWSAGGDQRGPFVFKLNEDLDRFDGQWSRDGQNWRTWNGTLILD